MAIALTAASLLFASAPSATAEEGELAWSLGLTAPIAISPLTADTNITRVAPSLGADVRYAVSDFWELGGELQLGVGLGGDHPVEAVGQLFGEVRLTLDALTFVPYLCAGSGVLFRSDGPAAYIGGSGPAIDATVHVGLGVAYRPERDWSVGLAFRQHFVVSDYANTTGPMAITIRVSFHSD